MDLLSKNYTDSSKSAPSPHSHIFLDHFEILIREKILNISRDYDPAHDFTHFERVVAMAKRIAYAEKAKFEIVVPAAWLHDFVILPKNDPHQKIASLMAAQAGIEFLSSIGYPSQHFNDIFHAIQAHSFSSKVEPKSLEAKVVQDADRLDALGAFGIARCFSTSGVMKRSFYHPKDPFCKTRTPDDKEFSIDHFYKKLFKVAQTLNTPFARREGQKRIRRMNQFLESMEDELIADYTPNFSHINSPITDTPQ